MSNFETAVVRVGVGCLVLSKYYPQCILIGRRKSPLGRGLLALPGGHLELGESWSCCASREVKEETDLTIENVIYKTITNDIAICGNPLKHYITIFMSGEVIESSPSLKNMEPDKCDGWEWMPSSKLIDIHRTTPDELFDPLRRLINENGDNYFNDLFK
eukprot:gene8640-17822_t